MDRIGTHWADCWKVHLGCATAQVERLTRERDEALKASREEFANSEENAKKALEVMDAMQSAYNTKADALEAAEARLAALTEALEVALRKKPEALERLRRYGYVFERAPSVAVKDLASVSDGERWEHLAFSLYSDIVEVSSTAEQALATTSQEHAEGGQHE